jgi:ketosteroid isomerase-like protein
MARISSAAFVTCVLHFLQAYNAGDLDQCETYVDEDIDWQAAAGYHGRSEVRRMLEHIRDRFSSPHVRPEDFREAGGHVLMVVVFNEGDASAPQSQLRQSWIVDLNEEGLMARVVSYDTPAEAARAFDGLTA